MEEQTKDSVGAPLVDSHAHLSFADYDTDRQAVVARARQAGLTSIVTVGIEPADWPRTLEIAGLFADVYPAIGIHPNSADQTNRHTIEQLAELAAPGKRDGKPVVALGETGLDYYRQHVPHNVQRESLRAHLDLARQLGLPLIIHNRDAHADLLEILRKDGAGTRGVMHSFSGDLAFALECIEMDYMISLAGPVTFRKATDKHQVAASVPLEALMIETDCPFLTPEPYRGRRNEPAYVAYTARAIAGIRGISFEQIAVATTTNARRLFGIAS